MVEGIERRESRRINYPMKIACICDYRVFEARANNLSLTGACLLSPEEFEPGNDLGVIIRLPGKRKFSVIPAKVIWTHCKEDAGQDIRYETGVEYIYLLPELAKDFNELLKILK